MSDVTKGDRAQYESAERRSKGPSVTLLSATPDPLGAIAATCKMYNGEPVYNLADVTHDERVRYWREASTESHLRAPLEFVDLHFIIDGVTRAFTHQLVRQRTAVYAQESLRFAVITDLADKVDYPPSIKPGSEDAAIWDRAIAEIHEAYAALVDGFVPAEDARGLLPHAVTTRVHYKTNLRNLLDHVGNRLCTQAQYEWRLVIAQLVESLHMYDPPVPHDLLSPSYRWQWTLIATSDVFKPVCYSMGKCPFKASFDRGCTIRERVDRGAFDEIDDAEWKLDPAAGRTR